MIMTNKEFIEKALNIANNYKTLYVLGCFGAPMTVKNKKRYSSNYAYNKNRANLINSSTSDTFGFDCVCLIKGILWGWNGALNTNYGGATYCSNNVPDMGANSLCNKYLKDVSKDFTTIVPGEVVWMDGHVGIYVGDGKVVECTPKWKNCVQITNLGNLPNYKTGNYRLWAKHGYLPWVDYSATPKGDNSTQNNNTNNASNLKTNEEIAKEVIRGLWGNGAIRKTKLREAGYDPLIIQTLVNKMLK